MCIHFRDLNKTCPKDFCPLPRIDQLVDSTFRSGMLSMMDASQGYHQIMLVLKDRKRVNFITSAGMFYYVVMPFGLRMPKPPTNICEKQGDQGPYCELGRDILRFEKLSTKAQSCKVGRSLGIMVTQREIEANPFMIKAILNMRAPFDINEVQRLTGTVVALSRFITKMAEKSLPFFNVLRKAKNFYWDNSRQQDFEGLKRYLARLALLVKPSPGDTFYVHLSTTPKAIGFVLTHDDNGKQMPVYYVSKVLNGAEGRYTPIEKMTLVMVIIARRLCPYFLSHPIGVKTNLSLKQTLGKPDTSGLLVKWAVKLKGTFEEGTYQAEKWLLHVDGSSTIQGSGAGIVITSPQGEDLEFTVKFGFRASNNEAEYEALITGLKMAHEVGGRHLIAYSDSQLIIKQVEGLYEAKEENMIQYQQQIVELKMMFESFQTFEILREIGRSLILDGLKRGTSQTIDGTPQDLGLEFLASYYKEESFTRNLLHTLYSDVYPSQKNCIFFKKYTTTAVGLMQDLGFLLIQHCARDISSLP
ncbi:UNVERIFIED_CONTAM: hypothetical protein Sindi_1822300 [Sesamum indicum]